jgi:tetratricopeptide (TPR) repeat protein
MKSLGLTERILNAGQYTVRADELMANKRLREALEVLTVARRHHPLDTGIHYRIALVCLACGAPELAEKSFRRILDIDPHKVTALIAIGKICVDQNRFSEARTFIKKASKLGLKNKELGRLKQELELRSSQIPEARAAREGLSQRHRLLQPTPGGNRTSA